MAEKYSNLLILMSLWLGYFALHSALASLSVKDWVSSRWPGITPRYRLFYNLLATLFLIPPLWLLHTSHGTPLWAWHGIGQWLADGLALAALLGFLWSLRYYDMGEFSGLKQAQHTEQDRRFSISEFHRFVRHPWYCFGLVIIWTRDMDPAWLVSCLAITLYFIVGSRWEEQKLITEFGDAYRQYRQRVPGLIPLPGKYLSRREAEELLTRRLG